MKIWVDGTYPAPDGYIWCKSVDEAKTAIFFYERNFFDDKILLDLSKDCINLLDWLEIKNIVDTGYIFKIHSINSVGVQNMRRIIQKNGWKEIF